MFDNTSSRSTDLSESIMCSVKELPPELQLEAARIAIQINPENAPNSQQIKLLAKQHQSNPLKLALLTNRRWPRTGVNLTVGFIGNPSEELQARILSHMNAWNLTANVNFTLASANPEVRISFDPGGYWSVIGTDIRMVAPDKPTMNLQGFSMDTPESEFRRVVRHETGHTLGFQHEHLRDDIVNLIDRDKAIAYYAGKPNYWPAEMTIAQVLTPIMETASTTVVADTNSIMCYRLPAAIMKNGIGITGGKDLSASDVEYISLIYPKQGSTRRLLHTMRHADGTWSQLEDLQARFEELRTIVSTAGARGGSGEIQVAAVTFLGKLMHVTRNPDGSWSNLVELNPILQLSSGVTAVTAASGENGTSHFIFSTQDGGLWHVIRESAGTWQPLRDLKLALGLEGRTAALCGMNSLNGFIHLVFSTSDGIMWHTSRNTNGSWWPLLNLSTALAPQWSGEVTAIAGAAGSNSNEIVFVFATNRSRLWYTERRSGRWTGLHDLGKVLQVPKRVIAVGGSSAGTGEAQFVFTTEDGRIWHTIRYREGGWQAAVPLDWVLPVEGVVPAMTGIAGDNGELHYLLADYH